MATNAADFRTNPDAPVAAGLPAPGIFRDCAKISAALQVLVVDDEPLIRWAIGETLTAAGCHVVGVADRSAALRELSASGEPFDVVVLDYWLPDSEDLTLLASMRTLTPTSEFVMMSARATPEIAEQAARLGVVCLLQKPFEMQALVPIIRQAALHKPL